MARRQQRQNKPDLTAIYAFMGIAIAAILTAAFVAQQRKASEQGKAQAAPQTQPEDNPFADLAATPPKVPTRRPSSSSSKSSKKQLTDLAPPSVLSAAVWMEARSQADIAMKLLGEAELAKKKDQYALYEQKAVAGREILDKQLENTADWEAELFEQYGDNDRIVDKVSAIRSRWFKQVGKYRKVKVNGE